MPPPSNGQTVLWLMQRAEPEDVSHHFQDATSSLSLIFPPPIKIGATLPTEGV